MIKRIESAHSTLGWSALTSPIMAFTLSHAAAALPFRKLCREGSLHLPALIIGSFSPDLGYFLGNNGMAKTAHTALGSITVCLPVGIVFLALFYLVRRPLIFALPSPHRYFLSALPEIRRPPLYGPALAAAGLSLLIGAWTHILWDGFTHSTGWAVQMFPALRQAYVVPFFENLGGIPAFRIAQHASSIIALALMAVSYYRWAMFRRANLPKGWWRPEFESWRYYFWTLVFLVPAAYTASYYWKGFANGLETAIRNGVFFNAIVVFTSTAFVFAVAGSLVVYLFCGWKARAQEAQTEDW